MVKLYVNSPNLFLSLQPTILQSLSSGVFQYQVLFRIFSRPKLSWYEYILVIFTCELIFYYLFQLYVLDPHPVQMEVHVEDSTSARAQLDGVVTGVQQVRKKGCTI